MNRRPEKPYGAAIMLPRGIASFVVAFFVVVASAVVCGRFPLTANPGPESGMVLAVVGGVVLALACARAGARRDPAGFFADWVKGAVVAGVFYVVFLIATAIGAAISPTCSPSGGRLPMFILSVPVLLLQAGTGTAVGRVVGRPGVAFFVCLVVEAVAALSLVLQFLDEPSFRAASHLFVVVSGDLLRGAELTDAAIGFRCATALLAALVVLIGSAWWPATKKSGLVSASATTWPLWVAAVVVGVVFVGAHRSSRSALSPSRHEMEETYALVKRRGPLVVHADPLATTPREVDGILAEGTLWMERLEARLGPLSRDDIDIWIHASRDAQARWTGASHVDFSLPWRRELHIAGTQLPHRSLGHELAHVVVGEKSDTLLKVPARFGVLHNPAVTEGVAMALTPELVVDDGLTLREQAAAMRRTGHAPDLKSLFSFSQFFAEEPGRAYVAAGALVEQLIADEGADAPAAIARLYRGDGSLDAAVVDVDDLIARHTAALDALPLPDDALAFAAARFSRPSILEETCDPETVKRTTEIRSLARAGHLDDAMAKAAALEEGAGALDERHGDVADGTLTDLLVDVRAAGDEEGGVVLLQKLVERAPNESERALRQFALGGELWRTGEERDAVALWQRIDVKKAVVDIQRQILAARLFGETALRLHEDAVVSRAALAFFVDASASREGARLAFADAVGRSAASDKEGDDVKALGRYVLARQLVITGALDEAVRILRPLVDSKLLSPVFQQQAVLALGTALVRKDKPDDARPLFHVAADEAGRAADRLFFRDRAERAFRAQKAPPLPLTSTTQTDPASGDRLLLGVGLAGGF